METSVLGRMKLSTLWNMELSVLGRMEHSIKHRFCQCTVVMSSMRRSIGLNSAMRQISYSIPSEKPLVYGLRVAQGRFPRCPCFHRNSSLMEPRIRVRTGRPGIEFLNYGL